LVISLSTSVREGEIMSSLPLRDTRILNKGGPSLHCSRPIKVAMDLTIICTMQL